MRNELVRRFENLGERQAVVDREVMHSYSDLAVEIRRFQRFFEDHSVREHEVVVLNGDFSFPSVAALLALYLNRNIVVPVVNLTEGAVRTISASCGPKHVLAVGGVPEEWRITPFPGDVAEVSGAYDKLIEDKASGLVLLTSGTTGVPKAILHNFDSLVEERLGGRTRFGVKAPNILMFLLFDHIGGINSLLGALRMGGTAIVPSERTPEHICAMIEKYNIRLLPTSPTFLNLILIGNVHQNYDLSGLRLISYGTEPMPEELLKRVNAAFPQAKLLQTFGTSETGISTTTSESSQSTFFKIKDPNVQYRIVDGELQLKSTTQFMGYLNHANDALTEDGWFCTGDLVEENADGFITVKGRTKEIINVGGEKVLPLELESILLGSPLIDDCVVYGRPNSITGQSVCVDVRASEEITRAELRKHIIGFLAGKVEQFKVPAKVNVVDETAVSDRFKKKRIAT